VREQLIYITIIQLLPQNAPNCPSNLHRTCEFSVIRKIFHYNVLTMDSAEILEKLESFLALHPNAALPIAAARLGLEPKAIEEALREIEGKSFEEFRHSRKLAEAFKHICADTTVPAGPWEKTRARPRMIIPRTTVKYRICSLWFFQRDFSEPCPLVDLSSGGLAFLTDVAPLPGKRISMLLKFPEKQHALRVDGNVVYTVATGIAGYRQRIGVQFLPFAEKRGCNNPKVLEALVEFESK